MLGSTAARRGDVIRCTVLFENAQEIEGKIQVPVVYSVNGSRIVPEDKKPSLIEYSDDRPLFPFVGFDKENSVLAKVLLSWHFVMFITQLCQNTSNVEIRAILPKSSSFCRRGNVGEGARALQADDYDPPY